MVLALVVVVLCSRVYEVLNPEDPPPMPTYSFPQRMPPTDLAELRQLGFPGPPPPPPPPRRLKPWTSLRKRNPFWYNPTSGGDEDQKLAGFFRDPGVYLLNITPGKDGVPRAQLQTRSSRKWYDEGEQFEKFELISIDPENEECVIYSEEFKERVTIKKRR